MLGSKAERAEQWAINNHYDYLRFDYSGHGESDGAFRDGTISKWAADTLTILDECTAGPQILIGSSMGGWISMLTTLKRTAKIAGLVLIAPAPDFTETLMWPKMSKDNQDILMRDGILSTASQYSDEPDIITRALIEDGRNNLTLDKTIPVSGPVRILQGMKDEDVPWQHAMRAVPQFISDDVEVTLIKDGDHRLSSENDLTRLEKTLTEITAKIGSSRI